MLCLSFAAEGCVEMDHSLDGLLLTSEGTVVVDNPKALTASNAGLVSVHGLPITTFRQTHLIFMGICNEQRLQGNV